MKPFTLSKPKSKPTTVNPKSKPTTVNPKSKPAVANPKGKPATVKSMGIKSKGSNTETDNSPNDFHYLTHPRSCVDMFYNKNNVKIGNDNSTFTKVFGFHLNTNYYCSICTIDVSAQDNYCTKYSTIDVPRRYLNEFLLLISLYKNRPFIFKIEGVDKIFAATLIDLMRSKKEEPTSPTDKGTFKTFSKDELNAILMNQENTFIQEINNFCAQYKTNLQFVLNNVANTFKLEFGSQYTYNNKYLFKQMYISQYITVSGESNTGYVILNDRLQQGCSDIAQIIYNLQNNRLTDDEFKSCINDFFKFAFLFNGLKFMTYIDTFNDAGRINSILTNRTIYTDSLKHSKSVVPVNELFNISRRLMTCDKRLPYYSKLKEDYYIGFEYMKRLIFNVGYMLYRSTIMNFIYNIFDDIDTKLKTDLKIDRDYDFNKIQANCKQLMSLKTDSDLIKTYKSDIISLESLLNVDFKINGLDEKNCTQENLNSLIKTINEIKDTITYNNAYFVHLGKTIFNYVAYVYNDLLNDLRRLFGEYLPKDGIIDEAKIYHFYQKPELTVFRYSVPAQDDSVGLVRAEEIINNIVDSYLFKSK